MDRDRGNGVATIWLDRADARNALGRAFFDEISAVTATLSANSTVRAVVVAARGPDFSVGLDLKEMGGLLGGGGDTGSAGSTDRAGSAGSTDRAGSADRAPASPAARAAATRRSVRRLQGAITAVADCPKPVIAAIHGYCIGAGMDLVTACDVRLASADAVFSVRETRMAIVADLGSLQRLPRIIGAGHVAELALTGKDIDAGRAKEIGLVNEVYPDFGTVLAAATSMATDIAALSPLAVQGTKTVLAANEGRTIAQALDYVAAWNAGMLASDDLAEAVRAFLEKRPPRFTGG